MQKRREHPRLKFGVVVKDTRSKKQGTTRNISIDGCFIKKEGAFNELLPIGTPLDLVLTLPNTDRKITVSGVVRHHGTQEDGMGVSFEESCRLKTNNQRQRTPTTDPQVSNISSGFRITNRSLVKSDRSMYQEHE